MRASMEVYARGAARIEAEPGFCHVRALPDRRDPALAQRAFALADFDGHAVATPDWFDGAVDPGVKGPDRAREKVANEYGGDASLLKDLARCTVHFADCGRLAKNKFASPTPMGYRLRYRDLSCVVELDLGDATPYLCEIQLHHDGMLAAKKAAHVHYEVVRSALPRICADAARGAARADAGALEGFVVGRLNTLRELAGQFAARAGARVADHVNRRKAAHPARIRLSTPEAIADVDWDYCGSCVAVALKDKIRVYRAATRAPLLAFDYPCELDAAVAHVAWAPDDRALAVHDGKTLVVLSRAGRLLRGALFEVVACEVVAGDAGDADMPGCVAWTSATTVVVPVVTRPASGAPAVVLARATRRARRADDRGLARYGFAPRHRPGVKRRPKGGKFNGGHSGNHVVALGDGRCVVGAGSENFRGYSTTGRRRRLRRASGDKLAHTESPEYVHQWWNYSCVCVSDDGEKMCSVDEKTVRLWKSLGEGRPGDEWQAALAEPLAGDVAHGETIRRCAFEPNKWGTYTRLITAGEHELFFWAAKDLETYETR
ncbi:hypothetical protein SO694_00055256 [Aureococcus anophagefferens]|uniref:Uncharacterized protein n=1 Tax=Aureococcus anophagefferens TaxID=44056 RepID=A0ABR1FXH2_AURAN